MAREEEDGGFLSRWSRRKVAVAAGEEVADTPKVLVADDGPETAKVSAERQAELDANREAAEAIDIDALHYDSDFSAFFKDGVPQLLRQKALRVLWRSNPVLANVDGLCDYDENFGDPALILEKFESAYRIGKGYLFEDEETVEDDAVETPESAEATDDITDAESETANDAVAASEDTEEVALEAGADVGPPVEVAEVVAMDVEPERPRVSLRERLQLEG